MTPFVRSNDFAAWGGEGYSVPTTMQLQVGDVVAKISTGDNSGMYGPFDLTATDGRQTLANVIGVNASRVIAVDPSGLTERALSTQDGRTFTYFSRASAADGNSGFITDPNGNRISLNQETNLTTKNFLSGKQFNFIS